MKETEYSEFWGSDLKTRLFAYICPFRETLYLMRVSEYLNFSDVLKRKSCFTATANRRFGCVN